MRVDTLYLILKSSESIKEEASKLRGYIGRKFSEYPILHHHAPMPIYTYPRVQYKVFDGCAAILGIEEGARVLKEISDEIDVIKLGNRSYEITQRVIYEQKLELKPTKKRIQYRFITPWLALNPENYKKYRKIRDWKEKKEFINSIIIGNILSMSKGLGLVVDRKLFANSKLDATSVTYKGIPMLGFTGEFRVNFVIPDFFGIGKGVSHGFGTVKLIKK